MTEKLEEQMKKAAYWLNPNPIVVTSEADFFAAHEEIKLLKDDYDKARRHNFSNHRASYMGGGGGFTVSYFSDGKVVSAPGTSGAIGWGCHYKLNDLTAAGTVITVFEKGTHKLGYLAKELTWDIHFNTDLPFHKILKDAVILIDPKEKRVIATAFFNWNKRPQKLGAMFYIACRQAVKDYYWNPHYYLGKLAGLTPSESYILTGLSYGVFGGFSQGKFDSQNAIEKAFKAWIPGSNPCSVSRDAVYAVSADTGDGPMGSLVGSSHCYPDFKAFSEGKFAESFINLNSFQSPQPSNKVFLLKDLNYATTTHNRAWCKSWMGDYFSMLGAAATGNVEEANRLAAVIREFHNKPGNLFNLNGACLNA